ncbi:MULTISPECIES: non-heme iron oxygenase ferredoxin subunit [unclassified Sphingomonas]|uniref:non-heme iron oxygenase ferredoxin subunit n=1 Tax=unclassified Sphingomonas TaxID=196159 RepID=UPI00027CBBB0|nr:MULTISPECIES: non-heme iron oxygenase ferredoxin subunit [unclassified Sphingomonas]EJU15009.1 Rieske (2Fe-2S) domain-containing protein [Sphingomonas sp. LH128]QDK35583.1 non-heme iron oxygenase ferredoxin subunit [Sphingomonas sp. IC081]
MKTMIRLCKAADVTEGEPVAVNRDGLPALAVYCFENRYFATDNTCTHGNAFLTDGYQDGMIIECPFHGGAFDIGSGAPTAFPCQIALKTYKVVLDDGWIAIEVPDQGGMVEQ